MRQIRKQLAFIVTVMLIIVAVVASDAISDRTPDAVAQASDRCYMQYSPGQPNFSGLCGDSTNYSSSTDYSSFASQNFLNAIATKLSTIPQPGTLEYTLLKKYGAVFVSPNPQITLPPVVYFQNEQQTKAFQNSLSLAKVSGTGCYLQQPAAAALNYARSQARISFKSGKGGADCMRTYSTHSRFWRKYANNSTLARMRRGEEPAVLNVVAPPGSSQHLWGLAVDLRVTNQRQRQILNNNGWFQTVENDAPHWTYIGATKDSLLQFGFRNKVVGGISYLLTPL